MVSSKAETVEQYLGELPDDRREAIAEVRQAILDNLPDGYVEAMSFGMIGYEVPIGIYPDTYNGKPLLYAALASQKNHMAVYLHGIYANSDTQEWFMSEYEATGKKMDIGKSCVRFKKIDQLPVDLVGKAIGRVSVKDFVAIAQAARA